MAEKLVIDRNVWLRGEGNRRGALRCPSDGKMCCLGIYLHSIGFKPQQLDNHGFPSRVNCGPGQQVPAWLLNPLPNDSAITMTSQVALRMAVCNDDANLDEITREAQVSAGFAAQGIEVEFVN